MSSQEIAAIGGFVALVVVPILGMLSYFIGNWLHRDDEKRVLKR